MALVAARCPNCGGEIRLDDSKSTGFCSYCGSQIVVSKAVDLHRVKIEGKVSIDKDTEIENLLTRADQYMESAGYERAKEYYDRVIDIDAKNYVAWWNLYMIYRDSTLKAVKTGEYQRFASNFGIYIKGKFYEFPSFPTTWTHIRQLEEETGVKIRSLFSLYSGEPPSLIARAEKFLVPKWPSLYAERAIQYAGFGEDKDVMMKIYTADSQKYTDFLENNEKKMIEMIEESRQKSQRNSEIYEHNKNMRYVNLTGKLWLPGTFLICVLAEVSGVEFALYSWTKSFPVMAGISIVLLVISKLGTKDYDL